MDKIIEETKPKAANHPDYGKFTLIAFILPMVGIILGIVMITKDAPLDKKLGEHLIAASIAFMILGAIIWAMFGPNLLFAL